MKNMKKLAAMLMALLLTLTFVSAFAETEKGSITINNVAFENDEPKAIYKVYELLILDSYDKDADNGKGVYSYKINDTWEDFFTNGAGAEYITVREDGFVEWKGSKDAERVEAFASAALEYAQDHDIEPEGDSSTFGTEGSNCTYLNGNSVKFSNLEIGYYLVDSTIGALCGLTTTNPDISITAKNVAPTISKQVQEDSTGHWDKTNNAEIGETVNFRTTINVHDGAQKLLLHDTMTAGLTFTGVQKIEHTTNKADGTKDTHEAETNLYEVIEPTDGAAYLEDGCSFEVKFLQEFADKLSTGDVITVYYTADVNENATIGDAGEVNTAQLGYGDDHETKEDTTTTYTYGFDLVKTNGQNNLLDGASFKIYTTLTGGNEVAVELVDGVYRRVKDHSKDVAYDKEKIETDGGDVIEVTNGKVRVEGLDSGTYYLEEITWPDGYNPLTARQPFNIGEENKYITLDTNGVYVPGTGVQVVNNAGTILPSTGGVGTTLFYAFGGMMAIGAVILLVTKKRMSNMA